MSLTRKEALTKIESLEEENRILRKKLSEYENRDKGGRRRHDAKWQASYDRFVKLYEQGLSIIEIVDRSDWSRRTCYRYKAYYEALRKTKEEQEEE